MAEGAEEACRTLLALLREPGGPGRVDTVIERWSDAQGLAAGFVER